MHYDSRVLTNATLENLGDAELVRLLTTMLRIRVFEEKLADLHLERDAVDKAWSIDPRKNEPFPERKRIRTPCHLYIGQEAVAAGVCATMRRDDWMWSTHRSHGHYLAKGGDLLAGLAEIFCRETGCSRGRGGSMHLVAPEVGFLGSSSIVGGLVPLGVGAAMTELVNGTDRVSVIFHGDAVPEEGVFHEALNWAVLRALPAVFCCENNQYSTHLHIRHRRKQQDLAKLVAGYGIPVEDVDGNDVREVVASSAEAVERARAGGGPTFLQLHTYRWRGHVGPYDNVNVGLRSQDEIDAWISRCPIELEKRRLVSAGIISGNGFEELRLSAEKEVGGALEEVFRARRPPVDEVRRFVFKEGGSRA